LGGSVRNVNYKSIITSFFVLICMYNLLKLFNSKKIKLHVKIIIIFVIESYYVYVLIG
jgi:hypothetical protein